jgi:ABC-type lipoprotein release transport system permease subunit
MISSTYIRLAWRNLWRNKRRTLITMASVFLGVVLSTFLTSMQEASYEQYIRAIVNFYSGHIQLHAKGYDADKQINNAFVPEQSLREKIRQTGLVSTDAARLESFALSASDDITRGVMVIGIEPEAENKITKVHERLKQGSYIRSGDDGVVLGSRLAAHLRLQPGDTLVLISQGYHGAGAAGLFPVRGIIKHPSYEFDRQVVYMDIAAAQHFYSAEGLATSLVMMVQDERKAVDAAFIIRDIAGRNYEVFDWKQMNALMLEQVNSDRIQGRIMKWILYLVIAFGILGTLMMMMAERKKEFGVMIASGMQKWKLSVILGIEALLLGISGALSGIVLSVPVVLWFRSHPIRLSGEIAKMSEEMGFDPSIHFTAAPEVFLEQAMVIFFITLLLSFYSTSRIRKLKLMQSLRS